MCVYTYTNIIYRYMDIYLHYCVYIIYIYIHIYINMYTCIYFHLFCCRIVTFITLCHNVFSPMLLMTKFLTYLIYHFLLFDF